MMRELGKQNRRPFVPAANNTAPKDIAMPIQMVVMGDLMYCIVS